MTDPPVEAWQIAILVTAALVLAEIAVHAVLSRVKSPLIPARYRTAGLALLLVLGVGLFVAALGPDLADELSSVAAAVAAVAALWLTYRSYQSSRAEPPPPPPPHAEPSLPPPPSPPSALPRPPARRPQRRPWLKARRRG